jgi:hypothetical protein
VLGWHLRFLGTLPHRSRFGTRLPGLSPDPLREGRDDPGGAEPAPNPRRGWFGGGRSRAGAREMGEPAWTARDLSPLSPPKPTEVPQRRRNLNPSPSIRASASFGRDNPVDPPVVSRFQRSDDFSRGPWAILSRPVGPGRPRLKLQLSTPNPESAPSGLGPADSQLITDNFPLSTPTAPDPLPSCPGSRPIVGCRSCEPNHIHRCAGGRSGTL